jgi:TetR/AcrR family transcriptional repressor of bet genes
MTRSIDQRRLKGAATKRNLLVATIRSVAQHGLRGTTLTTVADLALVSRALVGFHFTGKQQLLADALDFAQETYDFGMSEALAAAGPDPRLQLEALVTYDAAFPSLHPEIISLWYAVFGEVHGVALYQANTARADRLYDERVTRLLDRIEGDRGDAAQRARTLSAAVFGFWLQAHLDGTNYDAVIVRQALLALLRLDLLRK